MGILLQSDCRELQIRWVGGSDVGRSARMGRPPSPLPSLPGAGQPPQALALARDPCRGCGA